MSKPGVKPRNVEEEGEYVFVKMWQTYFWQDGIRHPVLYSLTADGKPDYSQRANVVFSKPGEKR